MHRRCLKRWKCWGKRKRSSASETRSENYSSNVLDDRVPCEATTGNCPLLGRGRVVGRLRRSAPCFFHPLFRSPVRSGLVAWAVGCALSRALSRFQWLHRDHLVGTLLVIPVWDLQIHVVLLDFEFSFVADRKQRRVFLVYWPDVILHLIGSQQILGA